MDNDITLNYDKTNIFAKILRKELSIKKIYEDENVLCFEDIAKVAPIHWLVIPKEEYISFSDFMSKASPEKINTFFQSIQKIIKSNGLDKKGYKLVTNDGKAAGQCVFHFHVHLVSGKKLDGI